MMLFIITDNVNKLCMNKLDNVLIYSFVIIYFVVRTLSVNKIMTHEEEIVSIGCLALFFGLYFTYSFIRHYITKKRLVYKCLFVVALCVAILFIY